MYGTDIARLWQSITVAAVIAIFVYNILYLQYRKHNIAITLIPELMRYNVAE